MSESPESNIHVLQAALKHAEEEIRHLRDDLRIKRAQLIAALKSLEHANIELRRSHGDGWLAPDLQHHLRTPLTIIQEGISLLRGEVTGPLTPKQKDILDTTIRNVQRLSEAVTLAHAIERRNVIPYNPSHATPSSKMENSHRG